MEVKPENYKIKRIKLEGLPRRGKKYLTDEEVKELLNGNVYVEEKLDGKLLIEENGKYRIFLENLLRTHTIYYENLPDFKILLDVYDKEYQKFLDYQEKLYFALENRLFVPPLIYFGKINRKFLRELLEYSSYFKTDLNPEMKKVVKKYLRNFDFKNKKEGIVIKKYKNGKLYAGKIVRPEFEKIIDIVGRYEKYKNFNKILNTNLEEYYSDIYKIVRNYIYQIR